VQGGEVGTLEVPVRHLDLAVEVQTIGQRGI
jgi:hypothetical protein